jgi:hypothetical protein
LRTACPIGCTGSSNVETISGRQKKSAMVLRAAGR